MRIKTGRQAVTPKASPRVAPEQNIKDFISQGKEVASDLFPQGSLQQVSTAPSSAMQDLLAKYQTQQASAGNRSAEMQDILARRQGALGGFNAEENNAIRSSMGTQLDRSQQSAIRQLRGANAASGIRGGLAGARESSLVKDLARQRAQNEQDLFIGNVAQKEKALGAYEGSLTGAEKAEKDRQASALNSLFAAQGGIEGTGREAEKFNIEQGQRQKLGELSAILGTAGLSAAQQSSLAQLGLSEKELDLYKDYLSKLSPQQTPTVAPAPVLNTQQVQQQASAPGTYSYDNSGNLTNAQPLATSAGDLLNTSGNLRRKILGRR